VIALGFALIVTTHFRVFFFLLTLYVAFIVAFPALTAFTLPLLVTVAIFLLELDQLILAFVPLTFNVIVSPTVSDAFVLLSLTFELLFDAPYTGDTLATTKANDSSNANNNSRIRFVE
jgi:hypothetical protein